VPRAGELSRISLAIQTALSGVAGVPNADLRRGRVSASAQRGRGGGRRWLAKLGETRQVLVITHLPQVAARGTQHLRVAKQANGRLRVVQHRNCSTPTRGWRKSARMLGGIKDHRHDRTRRQSAGGRLARREILFALYRGVVRRPTLR